MKNTFAIALLFAGLTFTTISCTQQTPDNNTKSTTVNTEKNSLDNIRKERIAHNQKIFDEASAYGDSYVALNATYNLLADDSANSAKYLDTISALYVRLSLVGPAMKVAEKILEKDPTNEKMLDLKANAQMSMGNTNEAMNINRKLYEKDKKLKYLFQIASVQLNSRNFKDLDATISQIEKHPDLSKDSLEVPTDVPGQVQKVPCRAAVAYLRGVVAGEKQNFPEAKKKFKQAVSIYPQFVMAKRYLEMLNNPQLQQQQMQQQMPGQ
jgi:tetratricopeptide (TPR) repeat protein